VHDGVAFREPTRRGALWTRDLDWPALGVEHLAQAASVRSFYGATAAAAVAKAGHSRQAVRSGSGDRSTERARSCRNRNSADCTEGVREPPSTTHGAGIVLVVFIHAVRHDLFIARRASVRVRATQKMHVTVATVYVVCGNVTVRT